MDGESIGFGVRLGPDLSDLEKFMTSANLGVSFTDDRKAFTSPHPSETCWSNPPSNFHTFPSSLSTPLFPNLEPAKKNRILICSSHSLLDLFVVAVSPI